MSKNFDKKNDGLVNENIAAEKLLVISESGEQLGVMSRLEALKMAEQKQYDLVCVAPNAPVPVCKFMDYSKFRYDQLKRAREARKNQKIVNLKEIRLSPVIDVGDYNTKMRAARKFLTEGDKVKVNCRFRGRMIEQASRSKEMFIRFAEALADVASIEQQPTLDGRNLNMVLSAIVSKK